MAHTYEELKAKTVAELREIAKDTVQGASQMNKEKLLPALCQALGMEGHAHHDVHGIDKSAVKAQMRELKAERSKALDAHADKPALVVVHHNPQWTAPGKRSGIVDTELLFAQLVPRKHVKAVFFGHTHQWRRDKHEGIHLTISAGLAELRKGEMASALFGRSAEALSAAKRNGRNRVVAAR